MSDRYEVRLSGTGGQGLVLAGIILAEAAGIYEGKNVVQTVTYGPAASGGVSKADVVISNQMIDYPKCMHLDLLLAMSQAARDEYISELKPNGILMVDSQLVAQKSGPRIAQIPLTQIAREKCGREQMANIVALGALSVLIPAMPDGFGLVSPASLEAAVLARVPKETIKKNQLAFQEGIQAAEMIRKNLDLNAPAAKDRNEMI
jgi:2-oxoglutarate ferredoxin oxidoreductase subunit gamma